MPRDASRSHSTFDGYPNRCSLCGERALISKESLRFETLLPEDVPRTFHNECVRKARAARSEAMSPIREKEQSLSAHPSQPSSAP